MLAGRENARQPAGQRQSYLRARATRKSEPIITPPFDRAERQLPPPPPPPPANARPRALPPLESLPPLEALPPLESLDMRLNDALAARMQWEETVRTEREVIRALENAPEQRSRRRSVSLGVVALGSGDYQAAIGQLTTLIDGCGDDWSQRDKLLRLRAKAHRKAGALPAALHDSRSASQLHASGASLQLLGSLAASEGALYDAGHALNHAMAFEPPGRIDSKYSSVLSGIRMQRTYFSAPHRRSLPRVFDPRVELSDPSCDAVAHMLLLPPQPPPPPVAVRVTYNSIELVLQLPDDDGGDEIYELIVECSYYDVAWSARERGIFAGVREFECWHRGPAGVRTATWHHLEPDNMFVFRVRCANSIGYSDASTSVTVRTLVPAERGEEGLALPAAWLESDYADLLRDQSEERRIDGAEVLAELEPMLRRLAEEIHVVFKLFCALGSKDVMSLSEMQRQQFRNLAKEAELLDPVCLTGQQVDLIFQRANMDFRGGGGTAKAADEAGGVDSMVEDEFVNGLIRLAAARFGGKGAPFFPSLAERLEHLLEAHVLPAFRRAMPSQAVLSEVRSRRVRAILRKHDKPLRAVFAAYAAADISSVEAREAANMINLKELMFFAKEARLIDARFSLASLAYLFSAVNLENRLKSFEQLDADGIELKVVAKPVTGEATDEDAADDNEEELCFAEFRDILVRIAYEKFPPDSAARGSRELAIALDDWLEGQMLPLLTQCIKDKQRGVGQKHIV